MLPGCKLRRYSAPFRLLILPSTISFRIRIAEDLQKQVTKRHNVHHHFRVSSCSLLHFDSVNVFLFLCQKKFTRGTKFAEAFFPKRKFSVKCLFWGHLSKFISNPEKLEKSLEDDAASHLHKVSKCINNILNQKMEDDVPPRPLLKILFKTQPSYVTL